MLKPKLFPFQEQLHSNPLTPLFKEFADLYVSVKVGFITYLKNTLPIVHLHGQEAREAMETSVPAVS